jgi:hypothetical protein
MWSINSESSISSYLEFRTMDKVQKPSDFAIYSTYHCSFIRILDFEDRFCKPSGKKDLCNPHALTCLSFSHFYEKVDRKPYTY